LILQYVSFERSYDRHANANRIYRVSQKSWDGTAWIQDACGYNAAGPALAADLPEVVDYTHLRLRDKCVVSYGNVRFRENQLAVASAHFLTLFSLPLLRGDARTALQNPSAVVVSQSAARKYFGNANPMGKVLRYNDGYHRETLTVTGVMRDMPANTHLHLDMLVSYATALAHGWGGWSYGWNGNNDYVYVLLKEQADPRQLAAKMTSFTRKYLKDASFPQQLEIQPLSDIHLRSQKTFEAEPNGSIHVVYLLLTVGVLILLIAWVNYVNLSTARSVERAKEVGIRKVVGSSRGQLVKQFLLESLLINCFAIGLALTLFQLSLPFLDALTGKPLSQQAPEPLYWWGWIGVFIAGAVVAGAYPAFVLSGFQPVAVLKGRLGRARRGVALRRGLVVGQFVATVVLITGTVTVYQQLRFMQRQALGMNIDQTMVLYAPRSAAADSLLPRRYASLKNELSRLAVVKTVGISECLPGNGMYELNTTTFKRPGDPNPLASRYFYFGIDENLVQALGMKLLAGGSFSQNRKSKANTQLIINEAARKQLGFASAQAAVHQRVTTQGGPGPTWEIVGVIENYHHHSLDKGYDPILFFWDDAYRDAGYLAVKLNPTVVDSGNLTETIAGVKKAWDRTFPESPFDYFFLDERFNAQYRTDRQFGQVFGLFAGLAILVACLGLFGLSLFTTAQRTKEIGVRKVLGASVPDLLVLLSRDFIQLVLLATLIAGPLAYW
ncbi:MAG: ABC transporter permease, partial [Ferruginibacter sp.]|nr:ABC transporter permease [Cytophagales bacterium]